VPDHLILPPDPASVRRARRFLQEALGDGHVEVSTMAVLLVSELATNAVLHAGTDYTVRVELLAGGSVRAEVSDASSRLPVVKHYEPTAVTGRGLQMVASEASRWGVDVRDGGKTVWFELDGAASSAPSVASRSPGSR
jgi:anti-sigma regulatory factor (Ser/Thr protein kinase)